MSSWTHVGRLLDRCGRQITLTEGQKDPKCGHYCRGNNKSSARIVARLGRDKIKIESELGRMLDSVQGSKIPLSDRTIEQKLYHAPWQPVIEPAQACFFFLEALSTDSPYFPIVAL